MKVDEKLRSASDAVRTARTQADFTVESPAVPDRPPFRWAAKLAIAFGLVLVVGVPFLFLDPATEQEVGDDQQTPTTVFDAPAQVNETPVDKAGAEPKEETPVKSDPLPPVPAGAVTIEIVWSTGTETEMVVSLDGEDRPTQVELRWDDGTTQIVDIDWRSADEGVVSVEMPDGATELSVIIVDP